MKWIRRLLQERSGMKERSSGIKFKPLIHFTATLVISLPYRWCLVCFNLRQKSESRPPPSRSFKISLGRNADIPTASASHTIPNCPEPSSLTERCLNAKEITYIYII